MRVQARKTHVVDNTMSVSATNFLFPKINNIVDIWQYSNYYRFPHCRLRTILSKIGNAHTFLLPFSASPITNNIVENRKCAYIFTTVFRIACYEQYCRKSEMNRIMNELRDRIFLRC